MNEKLHLCRICLESEAKLPIFDDTEPESSIFCKLTLCLNNQIEDIEGYPRHICTNCNATLDTVCSFITTYRNTCNILQNDWHFVKEENNHCNNNAQSETEIQIEKVKHEPESDNYCISDHEEDSMPLLKLKLKKKVKEETVNTKRCKKDFRAKVKNTQDGINRIASSILEGEFAWTGDVWRMKSTKPTLPESKHTPVQRQKKIKIQVPKPKVHQAPSPRLCDICGQVFKDQDKLSLHKRKVHFKNPMKCPKCPSLLASEYYLNKHIKRKHDAEGKSFICTTCGRGFAFKGELTNHNKNVHNKHLNPKKVFTCKICNKIYKCAKSVTVHERSVHTGQRPAVCTVCGASFYHYDYLKEHMRLHTGETPFKCPICGRGYAQRGNMKCHLRIHKISEVDASILSKLKPNYLKLLKA